eukprot:m.37451 g.37451  ORF g.37451 m.37451 type:complete len:487 (+) comp5446_c0_seq2:276-1736(+)
MDRKSSICGFDVCNLGSCKRALVLILGTLEPLCGEHSSVVLAGHEHVCRRRSARCSRARDGGRWRRDGGALLIEQRVLNELLGQPQTESSLATLGREILCGAYKMVEPEHRVGLRHRDERVELAVMPVTSGHNGLERKVPLPDVVVVINGMACLVVLGDQIRVVEGVPSATGGRRAERLLAAVHIGAEGCHHLQHEIDILHRQEGWSGFEDSFQVPDQVEDCPISVASSSASILAPSTPLGQFLLFLIIAQAYTPRSRRSRTTPSRTQKPESITTALPVCHSGLVMRSIKPTVGLPGTVGRLIAPEARSCHSRIRGDEHGDAQIADELAQGEVEARVGEVGCRDDDCLYELHRHELEEKSTLVRRPDFTAVEVDARAILSESCSPARVDRADWCPGGRHAHVRVGLRGGRRRCLILGRALVAVDHVLHVLGQVDRGRPVLVAVRICETGFVLSLACSSRSPEELLGGGGRTRSTSSIQGAQRPPRP